MVGIGELSTNMLRRQNR